MVEPFKENVMDENKKSYFLDVLMWVVFPLTLVVWALIDSDSIGSFVNGVGDILFPVILVIDFITLIAYFIKKKNNDNY